LLIRYYAAYLAGVEHKGFHLHELLAVTFKVYCRNPGTVR